MSRTSPSVFSCVTFVIMPLASSELYSNVSAQTLSGKAAVMSIEPSAGRAML